jgi:SAM-dependent methyltransferase
MQSLMRLTPVRDEGNYSDSHLTKGHDYHRSFATLEGRRLMWELERQVLRDYLRRIQAVDVLDFACGTGRITSALREFLPSARIVGIDISLSMLAEARASFPALKFMHMDGRSAVDHFGRESVDLISGFRFFPNAEPSLRREVASQMTALLKRGSWLIVNNHKNYWSPSYTLRRITRRPSTPGVANHDIQRLFADRFEVVEQRSLGIWPQSDRHAYLIPWKLAGSIERFNSARLSSRHGAGYNTIWLLRKVR